MWKIVEATKASIIYIYIYIDDPVAYFFGHRFSNVQTKV